MTTEIIYSIDGFYYNVPDTRECGIWLSVQKHPLPVPIGWHRPAVLMACVMRGRDYFRICQFAPIGRGKTDTIEDNDELVLDYRDASWWTPGLEEAWSKIDELNTLLSIATAPARAIAAIPKNEEKPRGRAGA